jgi:hypothetical protein
MKKIKLLLVVFIMVLMTSCDALQVTATSGYDINEYPYNYNRIDRIYRENPQYFYDTYYMDSYGNMVYYNNHPYFLRYQQDYYRIYNHNPLKYYGYDDMKPRNRRNSGNVHQRRKLHVQQPIQHVQPQGDQTRTRTVTAIRQVLFFTKLAYRWC